jgi:hypothetical protein
MKRCAGCAVCVAPGGAGGYNPLAMSENDNELPQDAVEVTAHPKEVFEQLLCHHGQVFVALDGSAPGVILPEHLLGGQVVLDYNLSATVAIPDLTATDEGIRATLSFSREPFATFVPWTAVRELIAKPPAQEAPKQKPKLRLV